MYALHAKYLKITDRIDLLSSFLYKIYKKGAYLSSVLAVYFRIQQYYLLIIKLSAIKDLFAIN